MSRLSRRLRAALAAGVGGLAAACAPPEPEVIALETLRVRLWQPERLSMPAGALEGDLLEDAARVDVTLLVDGEKRDFSLPGERREALLRAAAEGSSVRAVLRTVGGSLPEAVARTPTLQLLPGEGAQEVVALLAPPDLFHPLATGFPTARFRTGICTAPDGRVWMAGGHDGTAISTGTYLIDPAQRAVEEGPGLAGRLDPDCAWDGANGVLMYGGCDAASEGTFPLLHSEAGRLGSPFIDVDGVALDGGCGSRIRRAPSGELFLVTGTHVQVLDAEARTQLASRELPTPRYHAQAIVLPGDEPRLLLAGGTSSPSSAAPVPGATLVTLSGGGLLTSALPELDGALLDTGGAPFAFQTVGVFALDERGNASPVPRVAAVSELDVAMSAFVRVDEDVFAVLEEDGGRVHLLTTEGALAVDVVPPRPGGHLVAEPGGALLLVGGGVAGVEVLIPDTAG